MSESRTGRPPRTRLDTLEAVARLAARGEIDPAGGGVPTAAIAEATGRTRKQVRTHVRKLEAAGKLERVTGIGPTGPRPGYLPVEGDIV